MEPGQIIYFKKANPNDLKMLDDGKEVLRINTLIWIENYQQTHKYYTGPILINNQTPMSTLQKLVDLFKEGRVYILEPIYNFIPENIK